MENGSTPMEQLRSYMAYMHQDLIERISQLENGLLKAFDELAPSNSRRMWQFESNEAALRSRVAAVEDRLMEVEKRLNIPPAA